MGSPFLPVEYTILGKRCWMEMSLPYFSAQEHRSACRQLISLHLVHLMFRSESKHANPQFLQDGLPLEVSPFSPAADKVSEAGEEASASRSLFAGNRPF